MALQTPRANLTEIGNFDILERVAEGGMGTVYKGRDRISGQVVALKVLPANLGSDSLYLKRFEQEFQAARRLGHPNVVRALDFGHDNNRHFLVMEYVEGPSLGQCIIKKGPLPEAEAVKIAVQIAQALHAAHEAGLIHRDVKPDNILLSKDGRVLLTDLGLVKDLDADQNLTKTRSGLGTPNFMAPEQFSDAKHADRRCDIYSLGATLYMAVTGQLPFRARGTLSVLEKKLKNELTPPRKLAPKLSDGVEAAICRALKVDPNHRPATCLEFIQELTSPAAAPRTTPLSGTATAPAAPAPHAQAAQAAAKPRTPERRVAVRYPSDLDGFCQPIGGEKEFRWSARVQNISATGISLMISRRFERGTLLSLQVEATPENPSRMLLARVVQVKHYSKRKWLVGCRFVTKLAEEDARALR